MSNLEMFLINFYELAILQNLKMSHLYTSCSCKQQNKITSYCLEINFEDHLLRS